MFLRYLRTLHKILSLVRRRVTRRLTRLQTICNALKYHKHFKNIRYGSGSVPVWFRLFKKNTFIEDCMYITLFERHLRQAIV